MKFRVGQTWAAGYGRVPKVCLDVELQLPTAEEFRCQAGNRGSTTLLQLSLAIEIMQVPACKVYHTRTS